MVSFVDSFNVFSHVFMIDHSSFLVHRIILLIDFAILFNYLHILRFLYEKLYHQSFLFHHITLQFIFILSSIIHSVILSSVIFLLILANNLFIRIDCSNFSLSQSDCSISKILLHGFSLFLFSFNHSYIS